MKLERDKLQQARLVLGYGIEMTAEKAGVSKNSVLRAEHGEDIRPSTARKIAAALEVRVADLIGESETLKVQPPLPDFNGERRTPTANDFRAAGEIKERCDRIEEYLQEAAAITDPDEADRLVLTAMLGLVRVIGQIAPAVAEKGSARALLLPVSKRFVRLGYQVVALAREWELPESETTEAQSSVTHIQQWTEDRAS